MPDRNVWTDVLGAGAKPRLTLVLGGARSGKSRLAERLALAAMPEDTAAVYIATARAGDAEMQARIDAHRRRRGDAWTTVEAPDHLAEAVTTAGGAVLLVDCLTLWLSNRMLADADIDAETETLLAALARRGGVNLLVSNEVGMGIVPQTPLGRLFRDAQGALNAAIAAAADCVILTAAGLPLVMKQP